MVENQEQLDLVFQALANPTRRRMIGLLAEKELTVGEVAAPLPMSLAAASKHLQVLARAGLVRQIVDGRRRVCQLDPVPLAPASAWIEFYERYWRDRLDALAAVIGEEISDNKEEKA